MLWDYAEEEDISIGKAVKVPILYNQEYFIRAGKRNSAMSLYNLSYLMMYKDKKGKMQTEWVIAIPDDGYVDREINKGIKFYGIIHILNWDGSIKKSYKIDKDGKYYYSRGSHFIDKGETNGNIKLDGVHYICTTTNYYSCGGTVSHPDQYCHFDYTSETCDWIIIVPFDTIGDTGGGTGDNGNNGGGTGNPNDYAPSSGECEGNKIVNVLNGIAMNPLNNNPCDEQPIYRDTINNLNNVDANCIFNRLKDNALFQQLLANFQDNKNLNVTFKMDNIPYSNGLPVAGQTHHDSGTTNFTITIDNTLFGNAGGIAATNTFLHEAFHANLWISAQQWYPNSLPASFQNMSLIEQIKYLDNRGGNGSAQHNYMATEINNIALALKEYTRVNYPNIYNSNPSYNSYLSMAYNGLDGTSCFHEFVNSLTGNTEREKIENYSRLKLPLFTDVKCP